MNKNNYSDVGIDELTTAAIQDLIQKPECQSMTVRELAEEAIRIAESQLKSIRAA